MPSKKTYSSHHTSHSPTLSAARPQGPLSPALVKTVTEVTAIGTRHEKAGRNARKQEVKLSLFACNMMVYPENLIAGWRVPLRENIKQEEKRAPWACLHFEDS